MEKMKESYTIDLSYATSASDIVYELSSIIDNDRAKNQHIVLKLGDVDLNQSQLLSIRSLINSINSVVDVLETNSEQTEIAAVNLGIIVSAIKEAEPAPVKETELDEPTYVQSYGYVKLEDHILEEEEESGKIEKEEPQEIETSIQDETSLVEEEQVGAVEIETNKATEDWNERNASVEVEDFSQKAEESEISIEPEMDETEIVLKEEIHSDSVISDEQADEIMVAKTEDIQDALDNIYASEVKLESILENEPSVEEGVISAEVVQEAVKNEEKYTEADFEIDHFATMYVKQTLRSGQIVNYDGNVVIIGDCHPGSEVIASGDITVWGVLSGIAHAGAKGNLRARVRALKMNAIQLRISDCYARKPDGMNNIFPERTSTFTPEEARIVDDEIVIFKIND